MKKNLSYTEAYQELEEILTKIKSNEISIDDLEPNVKRAKELVDYCQNKLRSIEKTVTGTLEEETEEN